MDVNIRKEIISAITKKSRNDFIISSKTFENYHVKSEICLSNLGCFKNHKEVIIFINNRLVDCDSVKKGVGKGYDKCY